MDVLLVEEADAIAVVTLNRPDSRNALSSELNVALYDALVALDGDTSIGAIVLTGAEPAFCAGLDLKEAAADGAAFFRKFAGKDAITQVSRLETPVIGAVNGATFTGGLEVALGCDFLVASDRAFFADTHVRVGILPGAGLSVRLPQAVGVRRALEMSMTGQIVDAATAFRIGLVNEVVPHEQLLDRALSAARSIAEVDAEAMRAMKRLYAEGSMMTPGQALEYELDVHRGWTIDVDGLGARRDHVIARNRAQLES